MIMLSCGEPDPKPFGSSNSILQATHMSSAITCYMELREKGDEWFGSRKESYMGFSNLTLIYIFMFILPKNFVCLTT